MGLNANAVSALEVEKSTLALWQEFEGYFDGQTHTVGMSAPVLFPPAVLRFQEASLPQPLPSHKAGISVVYVSPAKVERWWDTAQGAGFGVQGSSAVGSRQERMRAHCAWFFFLRAATQELVATAGDRLYGLLSNAMATKPLGEKGIHKLRPKPSQMLFEGKGSPSADLNYRVRMLVCEGLVTGMCSLKHLAVWPIEN